MTTWIKVYNSLPGHPKMLAANTGMPCSPGWLFVSSACYSNEHLTDGFIPKFALPILAPGTTKLEAAAAKLVEARLWHEVDGGWQIHDYGDVQRSSDEIRERRAADAARKASSRSARSPHGQNADSARTPQGVRSVDVDVDVDVEGREENNNTNAELRSAVRDCFAYWQDRCNHSQAKLTTDRRRKIEARLREGYTVEQIRAGIDGAARAAFVGENGVRHDDIELICRNATKLDSFIARATATPQTSSGQSSRQRVVADQNDWKRFYEDGEDAA